MPPRSRTGVGNKDDGKLEEMPLTHCCRDGWLVGAERRLPDDPSEFMLTYDMELHGCNQLQCWNCKATVRSRLGWGMDGPPSKETSARLHDSATWTAAEGLRESPASRLYFCRCQAWAEEGYTPLDEDEREDRARSSGSGVPTWRCAGHPPPTLPLVINDISIEAGSDFAAMVAPILEGHVPPGAPERLHPGAWLRRVYKRLSVIPDSALAAGLSTAIARVAARGTETQRLYAFSFFVALPDAPGGQSMLEVALLVANPGEMLERAWAGFMGQHLDDERVLLRARECAPGLREDAREGLLEALRKRDRQAKTVSPAG